MGKTLLDMETSSLFLQFVEQQIERSQRVRQPVAQLFSVLWESRRGARAVILGKPFTVRLYSGKSGLTAGYNKPACGFTSRALPLSPGFAREHPACGPSRRFAHVACGQPGAARRQASASARSDLLSTPCACRADPHARWLEAATVSHHAKFPADAGACIPI